MHDFSSKTSIIIFVADKIALDWATFEKIRFCKIQFKSYQSKECNGERRNKISCSSRILYFV